MERSIELSNGGNAVDWIFLALAHHALDDDALAREWLGRADRWLHERRAGSYLANYKALALRAEARALLGAE